MAGSRTDKGSVTYLVQGIDGGPIKIGLSNPTGLGQRIASLQTGYPQKLKLVKKIDGNHESRLHHQFAAHRLNGEWFSPAPELIEFCDGEASSAGYMDYRAGFTDGWTEAMQNMQRHWKYRFETNGTPEEIERALHEVLDSMRAGY